LQHQSIELGVEFEELAGGFVEVFVVEFGDAPLFFLHLARSGKNRILDELIIAFVAFFPSLS
jgi:hypothetical protein